MAFYRNLRGYKYQTTEPVTVALKHVRTPPMLGPEAKGRHKRVGTAGGYILLEGSRLKIGKGYAWDGASGPTFDTPSTMRASLVHDALYQLMREQLLDPDLRTMADLELRDLAIEDGMPRWRAWIWVKALGLFGGPAADSSW